MSSLEKVVLLVVSLLLMQVYLGFAAGNNVSSISIPIIQVAAPPLLSGALSNSITVVTAWVVPITLGADVGRVHNVLIDTGTSDLWINSQACLSTWCRIAGKTSYNPNFVGNLFINTNQRVTLKYFDGKQVTGRTTQDQLIIQSAPRETIPAQDFIRIESASGFLITDAYAGIMGLAPGRNVRNRLSVIEELLAARFINSKIFSINTGGTSLNIGNVPVIPAGQTLNYVPVVNPTKWWDFRADQINLNAAGNPLVVVRSPVTVRIETILPAALGVPSSQLRAMEALLIGGAINPATGFFTFSCTTYNLAGTNVVLVIGGRSYQIPNANLITLIAGDACRLNVYETSRDWIVGQNFLTLFNTVFDATNKRIGFVSA